jgi:predicted SnoaL-like aldol condensation-catalyzing enzyme
VTSRTAREVVELYNLQVWNERDFALAPDLFADSVIRHEVGQAHVLTRAEAVQRVVDLCQAFADIHFDLKVVVAGDDGEHVTIVYESTMTTADGAAVVIASIEVFRVLDGRITEVYNCGYGQGVWK